jgi:GDP-D-mannose 3', 5'-epimerase
MTMKVCVTGGAGMIGSRLVRALVEGGSDVSVVDNLWRGRLRYLEGIPGFDVRESFHEVDLADSGAAPTFERILDRCDAVIHLADIVAGIGYVFNNQYEIFRVNNLINTNVWRACAAARVGRVLYAGTACSFPRNLQLSLESVLREDQLLPAEPESAYGWSKLIGTLELGYMAEQYGGRATTLILHNVYGPNCDIDPVTSQVIPSLIRRIIELDEGESLSVWGTGRQGRAFVHVDDVAAAFIAALQNPAAPDIIQIGPDRCTSIRELVELLRDEVVRRAFRIEYDVSKPEGDIGRCADYSLAAQALGWEPRVSLVDGLMDTYRWIDAEVAQLA